MHIVVTWIHLCMHFSSCVLFVLLYHIYVNKKRQVAVMILGFFGCLFCLLIICFLQWIFSNKIWWWWWWWWWRWWWWWPYASTQVRRWSKYAWKNNWFRLSFMTMKLIQSRRKSWLKHSAIKNLKIQFKIKQLRNWQFNKELISYFLYSRQFSGRRSEDMDNQRRLLGSHEKIVRKLHIVNNTAEHGVALMQD